MISNLNSNSNQTKPYCGGITSLSSTTTSSDSSNSSCSSNQVVNAQDKNSTDFDNGFSIYNKNIDFYESFRSYENAAKEMSSVKQEQLINNVNSLVVASNNNNSSTNINFNNINGNNSSSNNSNVNNLNSNNNNVNNNNNNNNNNDTIIGNQKFKTTTTLVNDLNDLHNYSKSPNAIDEVTSKPRIEIKHEIEEDDDEIEDKYHVTDDLPEIRGEDGDDKTPDHHARRPMNAFLIFCKRHRSIVRDRHPNLENRSITKILGDWWANLDKEEKGCYTELAKMYKDAFFSANPNFKWYKLPAPPLRTLTTRPCNMSPNQDYVFDFVATNYDEPMSRTERQRHDSYSMNGKTSKRKASTGVGQFKLADETQMGGLSSLLNSAVQNDDGTNKDQSLQDALSETSNYIAETMSSSRNEPFVNMRNHFAKHQISFASSSTEISDSELTRKWHIYDPDQREAPQPLPTPPPPSQQRNDDDEFYKKSSRSCKGKRYQEIMKSISKNGSPNKRVKVKHTILPPPSMGENGFKHFDVGTIGMEVDVKDVSVDDQKDVDKKIFDATDFDLEEKIKALPALSLDEYLARKRETKKTKKKLGGRKNKSVKHEKQANKHEPNVSGSQKRKAPKESITRREVIKDEVDATTQIINIPTIAAVPGSAAADLFTLAEVAVQKASIDKPIMN